MNLMQNTAINDIYTVDIFSTPNILWGYGKVDALSGLQQIENTLNVQEYNALDITVYPNPTSSLVSFDNSYTEFESLEIFNLIGKSMFTKGLGNSKHNIVDMSTYEAGIYLFKFLKEGRFVTIKVIKD
ncbi:T9SS type A sorting domain-containing protein [Psychroflexus salis]|nr:T9SS type A sorting domain-containing protein [Psychroflexus salis]